MKHVIIGRGQNGWHSDGLSGTNKCSSSGGSLDHYLSEAEDGTLVYDANDADFGDFAKFVISGPMLDVTLPSDTVDSFKDGKMLAAMLPALGGNYKTLGLLAYAGLSSMDYISTDLYMNALRQIPGVKTGVVVNHQIVWDKPIG